MSVLFTCSIDDGHPSDMKMARLLAKHRLKGTFYIPIRNREGLPVMAPSQVREISQSFEIGSHTLDHCYLKGLSDAEARHQVVEGKRQLEDILSREVHGFCYPGGKYLGKHVDLIRSTGFLYARTTKNFHFGPGDNPYEMPTSVQFYPHAKDVYLRNFASGGHWADRLDGLKVALRYDDWQDRIYALFDHACRTRAAFHLWCHANDIDTLSAWNEMNRFLGYVASAVALPNRLDNLGMAESLVQATDQRAAA